MSEAEEWKTEEENVAELLEVYKQAMEVAHYGRIWYRIAGWAGHRGAQLEQEALARSEEIVRLVVNSTPRFQQAWREACDREGRESRALPLMKRVLRSGCTPERKLALHKRRKIREGVREFAERSRKYEESRVKRRSDDLGNKAK